MRKLLSAVCVVVTAVVMLTPTKTEAQNPTWELYGIDRHYKQYKPRGGWISFFYRWRTEERNEVFVYKPGGTYEGLATKKVWYGYSMTPGDDNYIPGYIHHSYKKTLHLNEGDPSFRNMDHYNMDCDGTKYSYLHQKYPVVGMEGKAHVVGTVVDQSSLKRREVRTHETNIKITSKHTTGGTKNFTVTVTYRVEGSGTWTKVSAPISLAPGESTTKSLSVPGGRNWADIISVDIRENKPPSIPQPPRTAPPYLENPPPISGRPHPIVRPRSEESSN